MTSATAYHLTQQLHSRTWPVAYEAPKGAYRLYIQPFSGRLLLWLPLSSCPVSWSFSVPCKLCIATQDGLQYELCVMNRAIRWSWQQGKQLLFEEKRTFPCSWQLSDIVFEKDILLVELLEK